MTVAATSDQIERDLQALLNLVEPGDRDLVRRAFEFARAAHAQQTRVSGERYITHTLAVATLLAELPLRIYRSPALML